MTDLETNSLHSGVYIAWLWQCLQWAMAISIPWPRLEGLNSQILGDPLMIDCYCYSQFQDVPNHVLGGRPCHVHHCDPRSHGPGEELFKMYQMLDMCFWSRIRSDPDNVVEVLMWTVDKNLQQFCAIFQLSKLFLCCWSLLLPHLQWSDDHSCTNFGKFLIKHFQLNFCLNHLKLFVFLVVKIGTECSKLTLKSRWYIQVGRKRKFSNLIFGETIWNFFVSVFAM